LVIDDTKRGYLGSLSFIQTTTKNHYKLQKVAIQMAIQIWFYNIRLL